MAYSNFPDSAAFGGLPRDGLLNNPAFRMNTLANYGPDPERDQRLYAMALECRMGQTREPASLMGLQLGEPSSPAVDSMSRDRMRDRDRDHRDHRGRDDRDRGRDRDRRRHDSDRNRGDWSQEREGRRHRDRSPVRSSRHGDDSDSRGRSHDDDDDEDEYNVGDDGDRGSDRHRSRNDRPEDKGGDKWVSNQPSRTIILRGLNQEIDEKIIGAELMMLGLPVKDIRLIRRQSGVSRGFAFVEFHNVADAQRWMEHTQGSLLLLNMYRASMAYSVTRDRGGAGRDGGNLQRNDWVCVKCLGHNFKRRDFCYNCNLPRKESEKSQKGSDGQDEIGTNPCNTLILRGLDALTTEEGLVKGLTQAFNSQLAPIKNVAVVRDDLNTSRGFGFVEFHSVSASTSVLDSLNKLEPPLELDGKQLLINYAKNTFNTTMAYIQQQQAQSQYYDSSYYQGQYYDPTTGQYYDYSQYYAHQAGAAGSDSTALTSGKNANSTNSAAAVAQAAIQAAQAAKNYQKQSQQKLSSSTSHETVIVNGVEYPVYPPPDTSTYQYEETSGYYYDPLTQLYYDASSQYYYNSTTGGYMYWDAEKSTYLPAPNGEDGARGDAADKGSKEEKKDKEKVKIAKKIAKDMEKWAKSLNAQKEAMKEGGKRPPLQAGSVGFKQESATADAGFAIMQKTKDDVSMMPPPPPASAAAKLEKSSPSAASSSPAPGLVASYGGDSDSGGEDDDNMTAAALDESKLVDWTKLACLLCKRQFQSKEILSKHTQVSDLHKQNLETLLRSKSGSSSSKIEYRDRAKERRLKYGAPEPPAPREKRRNQDDSGPVTFEQPTKQGIGGDNIGNKLLQKMGWSQGQGLGKANQGRTDPIEARRRNQMSGLGARGANIVADVGDSYRDALKKTMYARYNETD